MFCKVTMKRILVIDDEHGCARWCSWPLNQKGYEVVEAGNGATGIEVARQKELPDLILCDVNMDKMDGY